MDSLALWYEIRATGLVSLALLTASVCLGIATHLRWRPEDLPRSAARTLHRNVSSTAMCFLVLHVLGAVLNSHARVGLLDLVVPLANGDWGVWLAAGTIAFDLLIAIAVTSALRGHIGTRTWRAVHLSAYACWPLAVFHGVGMGTDAAAWWAWPITAACVIAVLVAGALRLDARTANP